MAGFEVELVVVANRCTDRTVEIAKSEGALLVEEDAKNLAAIRNMGVKASHAKFIITIDADSCMSPNSLLRVHEILTRDDSIGGGVLILPERWSVGIIATGLLFLPIALWYGISAGMFFFRRGDFDAIGGFNESLVSVEDIDFAKRLKAYGRKTGRRYRNLFRVWIVTSCRKFDHFGDWYFVLSPRLLFSLLRGRNEEVANRVWYDFGRE